jgi:glucan-binding YG repeat protein
MRKQTKVVAVASAAALLAIGASMTSFAATGWVEEDGTWYFYDNDGNRVEDAWKKSGENWYWLDGEEGGAMAIEKIVEDDDDIYYVDANGVMVRNTWVKVVNEDQDEDEDPAEYHYYYMQSNGKAYKASDNSSAIRFRTIDGKRYAFDDDGQMLYGWVNDQGERQSDDDGWENATYYLGNWDDGAMKTGWQKVYVYDGDEEDDMEHWFNFKSNGKKRSSDAAETVKEEKINGQRYGFDNRGVMVYEWTLATNANASKSSSSSWKYYNSAEDGKRVTKGWFKVVAPSEDNDNVFKTNYGTDSFATSDADDENERWYYADGDGNLYAGQIKKIKGKYYGFRPEGEAGGNKAAAMLSGLVLMEVDPADGTIKWVFDDGVDADELDDLIDWDTTSDIVQKVTTNAQNLDDVSLYYFGDEETDGAMKTGATTVTLDGESYNFLFSKTGGAEGKGKGLTGVDDNKYIYSFGCRIKASSDDKYQVVAVEPTVGTAVDIHATGVIVQKIDSADLKVSANEAAGFINDKDETVHGVDLSLPQNASIKLYLVNTSGNIQKSKVAAKDGDDWYFYVKNRAVKLYTNNKNLDAKATDETEKWENYVEYLNSVN